MIQVTVMKEMTDEKIKELVEKTLSNASNIIVMIASTVTMV